MIAMLIGYESLARLFHPVPIAFNEAIPIAILGLGVNVVTALLLRDDHAHDHDHARNHLHGNHEQHRRNEYHRDNNLRAAFVHVMADAAVSLLVIFGLLAARQFGWNWLDPVMGFVATVVILNWAWNLVRSAGGVLLDASPDASLAGKIAARLETEGDRISDLHLWRLGPGHIAAIISLVSDHPQNPSSYKRRLSDLPDLSHLTIEVEHCPGAHG